MAHWAQINDENIVTQVIVIKNSLSDTEAEAWLVENVGGTWLKTSYNTFGNVHSEGGVPLRANFAGVGFTYNPDADVFIPPAPYASWILNTETYLWDPPISKPETGQWVWDEASQQWAEYVID